MVSVCKIGLLKEQSERKRKKAEYILHYLQTLFLKTVTVFQNMFITSPQICSPELIFIHFALARLLNWNLVPI